MILEPGQPVTGQRQGGFTLVELMTACVIVSIALLGVYAIFRDSVQTARRLTAAWQDRQAAEAIVAQVCQAVESAVEMPPVKAIKTGKEADGRPFIECLTYGAPAQATLQWRRYRWGGESGVIDLRMIPYSGSQPVAIQTTVEGEDPWANVEPTTIGQGLKNLSIQFKTVGSDKWKGQYARSERPAIARVKATVGGSSVERIISCPLTASALEGAQ